MARTQHRPTPGTPPEDMMAQYNQNFDLIDDQDQTKIISNTGVPQILFGYQKQGFGALDYGLKVSKINPSTGLPYNVTTATSDQLYFSSAFNSLKVLASGTTNITVVVGAGADFVAHSLGFAPVVIAYLTTSGGTTYTQLPFMQVGATAVGADSFALGLLIDVTTSATELLIRSQCSDAAYNGGYTIKYYLLAETAN